MGGKEEFLEQLAKVIHESNREAVQKQLLVNKLGLPFTDWDDLSEEAKEGRRLAAQFLMDRYEMMPLLSLRTDGEMVFSADLRVDGGTENTD